MTYRLLLSALVVLAILQPSVQANVSEGAQPLKRTSVQNILLKLKANHPELKVPEQEWVLWKARQQQVRQWENPTLQFSAEDFIGSSAYTDNFFTQYGVQVEQNLSWPHKRALLEKVSDQRVRLAQQQYTKALSQVFGKVYQELLQSMMLRRHGDLAKRRLETLEQLVQLGRLWLGQGKVSRTWLLPFEQELLRVQRHVQAQDMALQRSLQKLRTWGMTKVSQPSEVQALVNQIERYIQSQTLPAWQQSSVWQELEAEAQVNQSLVVQAQQLQIPDVTVSGGVRYHTDQTWGGLLTMGLKAPLWHQYTEDINVANARLAVNTKAQTALLARVQLLWEQESMRLEDLKRQQEILQAELALLEEEYALTYQAFLVGKINQWELLRLSQRIQSTQQEALDLSHQEWSAYGDLFLMVYPFSEQMIKGDL